MRIFCHPYTKHTVALERISAEQLEEEINILEDETVTGNDGNSRSWENGRKALGRFSHEEAEREL